MVDRCGNGGALWVGAVVRLGIAAALGAVGLRRGSVGCSGWLVGRSGAMVVGAACLGHC